MRRVIFLLGLVAILLATSNAFATTVSVTNASGLAGQNNIPVNISVSNATPGITGIDLTLQYDANSLQVAEVRTGDLTSKWSIASNSKVPGTTSITIFGTKPLEAAAGSIVVLNFSVKKTASAGSSMPIHLSIAKFNEKSADSVISGVFTIAKKGPAKKK